MGLAHDLLYIIASMSLHTEFKKTLIKQLQSELWIDNIHEVPKIQKVIVCSGIGSLATRKSIKDFTEVENNLKAITGQKPVLILSKKAVSNFKLRENMPVMLKVTLRGERAYDFIERLVHFVLPRVRDFSWLNEKSCDKGGNLSFGFKDFGVFPEVNVDNLTLAAGVQVTIVPSSSNKVHSLALCKKLGLIFKTNN